MLESEQKTKMVDSKGRLTLGPKFANRTVIVREIDETEILVTLAEVVPEREAWLFRNIKARDLVAKGLEQAARGEFAEEPPDLSADLELAFDSAGED